jgi:hypothetical protein
MGTGRTHRAGIIWRAVPRNVPRPKLPRPLILLLCVTLVESALPASARVTSTVIGPTVYRPLPSQSGLQCLPGSGKHTAESADRGIARPLDLPAIGDRCCQMLCGLLTRSVIHFTI